MEKYVIGFVVVYGLFIILMIVSGLISDRREIKKMEKEFNDFRDYLENTRLDRNKRSGSLPEKYGKLKKHYTV